ncbi:MULTISPECIES: tail fiber domain-containing protein [Pantoea]|uniref:tail fiber domain-containing protein n=1 Tax=Pantoea TaxID=53335 RepID=UPI0023F4AD03|nr:MULTISPECIES: tail fiber domain-containing protein [Pantoea]MDU6388947.1 tail fiber domain-containing protein [Pantoea sp.]
MPAGTITLTNNSTTVTGSGTSFTSELKPNDFIVAVVGGVTYTLGVQSVASATGLTLITAYNGPTTSGIAWTAVPNAALVGITAQVAADVAKAIRGLNLDKANWQQVFSGTGTVTVNLPDGSTYSGPAWSSITTSLNGKANSTDVLTKADNLNSVADKSAARTNLGLKGAAVLDVGTAASTVAAGNDSRLGTLNNKSGGNVSSLVNVKGDVLSQNLFGDNTQGRWSSEIRAVLDGWGRPNDAPAGVNGAYFGFATISPAAAGAPVQGQLTGSSYWHGTKRWYFPFDTGNAIAPGTWVSNSDERIKTKIQRIDDPLGKMKLIKGVTWERLDNAAPGIGFIAQDVQAVFPDSVFVSGDRTLKDGTVVKDILSPDTSGVAAALHHEAILALMDTIEKQNAIIAELQSRMKAIDGLDA